MPMFRLNALDFFAGVAQHPGIYVYESRFFTVCAFMEGYDLAMQGGALQGFREWLAVRTNERGAFSWSQLIRLWVCPGCDVLLPPTANEDVALLLKLEAVLREFDIARKEGLHVVFHEYNMWLLGDSETWTQDKRDLLRTRERAP